MKFRIVMILFILSTCKGSGQFAVRLFQLRPTGELGQVMKKKFTGEVMYLQEFEDGTRTRFGISYTALKPRLDTFPVVAIEYSGSTGTRVIPGYQVFHKYNMVQLFGGMDLCLLDRDPLFLYAGLDVIIGGIMTDYDLNYESYKDESNSLGEKLGGLRFRGGAEYMLNKHAGLFLELSRSYYLVEEEGFFHHNEFGLGFHYVL